MAGEGTNVTTTANATSPDPDKSVFSSQNFESRSVKSLDFFSYAYSDNLTLKEMPGQGTKSLFNDYSVFRYSSAAGDFNALYDKNNAKLTPVESRNPSATQIITWSQENASGYSPFGSTPYAYADFLYCKYYGLIPNNYLVTLRRFPIPMLDNLRTPDEKKIPPIAQAVTWMGEETGNKVGDILKFAAGLNWKEIEAKVQEVTGNERGFESSPFATVPGGNILAGIKGFLNPKEYSGQAQAESDYAKQVYGSEGPYANKVYGPVNSVNKTMARDMGLKFEHDIALNFHYSLKSIGGINPKAAMLDILANILTLTYNNAKFWGGAIRYFPQHPNVSFFGDQKAFYAGDVEGYIDSVVKEFKGLGNTFMDTFSKLLQDPISALKELATGGAKFAMGKIAAKDRPQILAMNSLLTGRPVGEWHLVVGNPMNPIAMMGNLICTDVEFEFGELLGADDFPTEMKVTIKLKHGKPRDKGDIESMFNLGNGRLYYGIKDDSVFASTHNSVIDTSGTKGEAANNTETGRRGFQTSNAINEVYANGGNNAKIQGSSMYGNKFNITEINIARTWAGEGHKDTKTNGNK